MFIRPVNSVTVNSNYFAPGILGGDHAFKLGGYWKDAGSESYSHRGGFATVRFPDSLNDDCSTLDAGCEVDLVRDRHTLYDLTNIAVYAQDTITHSHLTLQLGVRYDRTHDRALPTSIAADPRPRRRRARRARTARRSPTSSRPSSSRPW